MERRIGRAAESSRDPAASLPSGSEASGRSINACAIQGRSASSLTWPLSGLWRAGSGWPIHATGRRGRCERRGCSMRQLCRPGLTHLKLGSRRPAAGCWPQTGRLPGPAFRGREKPHVLGSSGCQAFQRRMAGRDAERGVLLPCRNLCCADHLREPLRLAGDKRAKVSGRLRDRGCA